MSGSRWFSLLVLAGFALAASNGQAVAQSGPSGDQSSWEKRSSLRLASFGEGDEQTSDVAEVTPESWEIDGPVFLRSADPEPPAIVILPLVPKPIAILSTSVRTTPWSAKSCSGITHSVQVSIVAAAGSALTTTAEVPLALESAT